jgi:hypothetical protein
MQGMNSSSVDLTFSLNSLLNTVQVSTGVTPNFTVQSCFCVYESAHTANEGLVRIQYKCLVPIYVFPEMKLIGLVISKTEL